MMVDEEVVLCGDACVEGKWRAVRSNRVCNGSFLRVLDK